MCKPQTLSAPRWLLLLGLLIGYAGATNAQIQQADFSLPESSAAPLAALALWATHYNVKTVEETPSGVPLRGKSGHALTGNLAPRDWCLGAIEGTFQIRSKDALRTYNYAGIDKSAQIDCATTLKIDPRTRPWIISVGRSVFAPARGPYGDGVQGFVLVPYRTIAVDPTVIPIGSVVYIPQTRGMKIRSAATTSLSHDGYFFAADSGGAIKGHHIDIFCGADESNCLPDLIASDETRQFKAFLVTDPAVLAKLKSLHTL